MFNDRTEPLGLFGAKSQIAIVVQPTTGAKNKKTIVRDAMHFPCLAQKSSKNLSRVVSAELSNRNPALKQCL